MDLVKSDIYKTKAQIIEAEKLECDVEITMKNKQKLYIQGGNYLIKGPDGYIYPADKRLFEFLFEKEEQK